jgi:DNA-binding transcriptional ArsR family regulator
MSSTTQSQGNNLATIMTHPIRARILAAMAGRELTTQQIGVLLPDVPTPSLYRHLRVLSEAGILILANEVRVNGAATRVYAINPERRQVQIDEIENISKADQLRYFTIFLNMLTDRFRDYLEQAAGESAIRDQPHHALMAPMYLSREEYSKFMEELNTFLQPWCALNPEEDRQRVIFAHIALPDRADPPRE